MCPIVPKCVRGVLFPAKDDPAQGVDVTERLPKERESILGFLQSIHVGNMQDYDFGMMALNDDNTAWVFFFDNDPNNTLDNNQFQTELRGPLFIAYAHVTDQGSLVFDRDMQNGEAYMLLHA